MFNEKRKLTNNDLFSDYKATVLAAALVENGTADIEDIEVMPKGGDKRAFAKDVDKTTTYFSELRLKERLRIETNRESLYDMLPEGLFHRAPKGSAAMDEEGMMKDIRERREEEKQARLFFSPFDLELNHIRILATLYEDRLDKKTTYAELSQIFEYNWEEFKLLNKQQGIIWMHLLPEIQQRRNDFGFIAKVLTALFNVEIALIDSSAKIKPQPIGERQQIALGAGALGIDTIIGNNFLPENDQLTIKIGPATAEEIVGFMPEHKNRKILDMAIDYLIPVGTDVAIEFVPEADHRDTTLQADGPNVYLGYTVYL